VKNYNDRKVDELHMLRRLTGDNNLFWYLHYISSSPLALWPKLIEKFRAYSRTST